MWPVPPGAQHSERLGAASLPDLLAAAANPGLLTHPTFLPGLPPPTALNNFLAWRRTNMPTTPVWVTEWGWDAHRPGEWERDPLRGL